MSFFDSVIKYPIGTLLFSVALLNLVWVLRVIFFKKNYKNHIYRIYFFYAVFVLFWVISNAYFQSGLLFTFDKEVAKLVAILANVFSSFAIVGFFLLANSIRHKQKKLKKVTFYLIFLASILAIVLNFIPNLTIKDVDILPGGHFQLIFGPGNGMFFALGIFFIILAFYNFILAAKNSVDRIQNRRIYYILFAMSLMYGSVVIFHIILPNFFNNYDYVWIPPFLSMADVALVGYAMVTKRFLDIRSLITNISKKIFAFVLAILIGFPIAVKLARIFGNIEIRYLEILGIAFILFLYNRVLNLLNSRVFYSYFGGTDAQHIKDITNELRYKNKIYTSIKDYEKDLQLAFLKNLKSIRPQIVIIDEALENKFPNLIRHFRKNRAILVTEEVRFEEKDEKKMTNLLVELESLGGVCIPIFHPSKDLVAFFSLGDKKYGHLYSREEITALEELGSFLNATVTGILYNSELQAEVDKKTKELKNKIHQINELVDQQSDFIAVTAHEFRTPLSIATFLLEDILQSRNKKEKDFEELKMVEASLENLKDLTEKLFAVQQYDLNKVTLSLQKTEMKAFIKEIYQAFQPLIKEKKQKLKLDFQLNSKVYAKIDPVQFRQVLHNLLKNASKFSDQKGLINIAVKEQKDQLLICVEDNGPGIPAHLKKSVFEKFRTNSSGAGIGLGLYLCKKIIELHKGKIWVQDGKKKGAIFCIQLPILS